MLSFERPWNVLSVVSASSPCSSLVEGMPSLRVNETHSIQNDLPSFATPLLCLGALCSWGWRSPTPWPSVWCRTRRIILPLLGLTYVSQRSGCTVIYIPKKQVMFFETRMWAFNLRAVLRKGQICVASEKGEAVHWGQCKCSCYWFPSKSCTVAKSWPVTGISTNWL